MGKYHSQTILLMLLLAIYTNTSHSGEHTKKSTKSGCFSFLCFFQVRKLNRSEQPQENEQTTTVEDQIETIQHSEQTTTVNVQRETIQNNDKKNLLNNKNGALLSKSVEIKNAKKSKEFLEKHKNLYNNSINKEQKKRIVDTLTVLFNDSNSSIDKYQLEKLLKGYDAEIDVI